MKLVTQCMMQQQGKAIYVHLYKLDANKVKRLKWAQENKDMDFDDVIYTDESTVQIETHYRTCCYKRGQKPCYKPMPKHPAKAHVWAGITHHLLSHSPSSETVLYKLKKIYGLKCSGHRLLMKPSGCAIAQ